VYIGNAVEETLLDDFSAALSQIPGHGFLVVGLGKNLLGHDDGEHGG